MRFAHIADCHIGGWHEPKMRALSDKAFIEAIGMIIRRNVDFLLISGDLFNTSLPAMDSLKMAVRQLRKLKRSDIPVYIIAGSHDFSPTGKTMIDILCEAGLCINVVKADRQMTEKTGHLSLQFTKDPKTGIKIAGMLGRRGMLEKIHYEDLNREPLESEQGRKIFMFHTAITELKPKELEKMESSPISLLPKGFDYYAGGHVHIIENMTIPGYRKVVYPGPVYPNSFSELEKLKMGSMFIVDDWQPEQLSIPSNPVINIRLDCKGMDPEHVESSLKRYISENDLQDAIVLIRLYGKLGSGKLSDIDFRTLFDIMYGKGAYFIMKNTTGVGSIKMEDIRIKAGSTEEIERTLIEENSGKFETDIFDGKERHMIVMLMEAADSEKNEGEKVFDFERRITEELDSIFNDEAHGELHSEKHDEDDGMSSYPKDNQ